MKTDLRSSLFRVIRAAVVVAALLAAGTWLRQWMGKLQSEQAVINAELIQIRTPIGGQLDFAGLRPGTPMKKGEVLLRVRNARFGDQSSAAQANVLQTQVDQIEGEALGARYSAQVEEVTVRQYERLFKSGSIARQELMRAQSRLAMAEELVRSKDDQLTRARERAKQMDEQSALQKECVITMPTDGVIWSVASKPGEQVEANQSVVEILNPAHLWVDAFFAERHVNEIRPGLPVRIDSLDGTGRWTGVLQSVRAGVGRLAVDSSVAVPPPESVKRQIAVRVEAQWEGQFDPTEFCRVGRSVLVSFRRDGVSLSKPVAVKP
jgi:multidrug resistance efflux pump